MSSCQIVRPIPARNGHNLSHDCMADWMPPLEGPVNLTSSYLVPLTPPAPDVQRERFAIWDERVVQPTTKETLDLDYCEWIIRGIFAPLYVSPPEIIDTQSTTAAWGPLGRAGTLRLPRRARSYPVLLRETARALSYYARRGRPTKLLSGAWTTTAKVAAGTEPNSDFLFSNHGPIFLSVYIDLLGYYGLGSASELRHTAIKADLEVARLLRSRRARN